MPAVGCGSSNGDIDFGADIRRRERETGQGMLFQDESDATPPPRLRRPKG
jgi:hypothetical protein